MARTAWVPTSCPPDKPGFLGLAEKVSGNLDICMLVLFEFSVNIYVQFGLQ